MNKILSTITLIVLLSLNFLTANAITINWADLTWAKIILTNPINEKITVWDIFNSYASYYEWKIPNSYKYITVNFLDVEKWSVLESSLQKLIYSNVIPNPKLKLNKDLELSAWNFYRLTEKIFSIEIIGSESENQLLDRTTSRNDIDKVLNILVENEKKLNSSWTSSINLNTNDEAIKQKIEIFNDVYDTIINWHYDKESFSGTAIIDSAISWLAEWTKDKHTVYFPPIESKSFQDGLSWNYEWIGSYVDMETPWKLRIISPVPGSPSEKAWLKWWDIVTKVDWKEITKDNSLSEVVSWIKWPAWTTVTLTIDREWTIIEIKVIRANIIIKDIEYKVINGNVFYIQIKSFWESVSSNFRDSLLALNDNKSITKVIIDVRNNWGGYLNEVAEMLSYFVKEWKNTAVVKYHNSENRFTSRWYDLVDFSKYKLVILQNSWTASASEILIGTVKDYFPNVTLIWEKTYGKWSVQVIKNYNDWSLLKYTIAKWFTWLTETWIDWIGIKPTIELWLDLENYNKNWVDNQLEKAINTN